jgi:hypothetical protein
VETLDFRYAPGAQWVARHGFTAPLGKDTQNRRRSYNVQQGERIQIDAVFGDRHLIAATNRPTYFGDGSVWMDKNFVTRPWLDQHFIYQLNNKYRLYRLTSGGQPWSILGGDRILDDDDAMLELAGAFHGNVYDLSCILYRSGSMSGPERYSLYNALDILRLLKGSGLIEGYSDDWYEGNCFEHMIAPWVGLIAVYNGRDHEQLRSKFFRQVTAKSMGQKTIFIVEDEEEFFLTKMKMSGPQFLHRERSHAAL